MSVSEGADGGGDALWAQRYQALEDRYEALKMAYSRLKDQRENTLHQEKLMSLGQLSAGVAHEINNPLAFVQCNLNAMENNLSVINAIVEALSGALDGDSVTLEDWVHLKSLVNRFSREHLVEDSFDIVQESIQGLKRISDIVESLKKFARRDESKPEVFSISDCLAESLTMMRIHHQPKVHFEVSLSDGGLMVGLSGELVQVFNNILLNALDALDGEGSIRVSTYALEGTRFVVSIDDNGHGMNADVMKRIFDPFFTTKSVGMGMGVGLSISYGIVKRYGGKIEAESIEGVGTTFRIILPCDKSI